MENVTLKNSQIEEQFREQVESERVFLVGIKDTVNPDVKQLEFAQKVNLRDSGESNADILQTLMGWSSGTILRTWQNVSSQVLERLNPRPGMFADDVLRPAGLVGPFSLQITEYTENTNPVKFFQNVTTPILKQKSGAKAKINPQTGETVMFEGKPVYRDVTIVRNVTLKHVLLKSDASAASEISRALTSVAAEA